MDIIQILVLALVQGVTEFLPISSSAHLILVPELLSWQDQGLSFDIAVHVGTLFAVCFYFRKLIFDISFSFLKSPLLGSSDQRVVNNARLGWQIIIATIPIIIAGLLAKDFIETSLRSPIIIAIASIVFGVWLWLADRSNVKRIALFDITWRIAIIIGLMQVLALIPGTSRSGITLTAAFLLAVESKSAAKFSFLLSIPTILGAALLLFKDAYETNLPLDLWSLFFGALISGIAAYLCIHFFIKALERIGMLPFMIYRILLGLFLLIVFL